MIEIHPQILRTLVRIARIMLFGSSTIVLTFITMFVLIKDDFGHSISPVGLWLFAAWYSVQYGTFLAIIILVAIVLYQKFAHVKVPFVSKKEVWLLLVNISLAFIAAVIIANTA